VNKIKYYRQQMGLTVRALSIKADVAIGYISMLENDERGSINPTKCIMDKIAAALEQTVPEVFFPITKEKRLESTNNF
jgi:transcriptional regulator with XRE-family HTH domain